MDSADLRKVAIGWPREPRFSENLASKSKSESMLKRVIEIANSASVHEFVTYEQRRQ